MKPETSWLQWAKISIIRMLTCGLRISINLFCKYLLYPQYPASFSLTTQGRRRLLKHYSRYGNQLQSNGSKYNLIYSTPSCYLKAVHDQAEKEKLNFYVKTDDYFPYASDPNAYWTGYFTSKPTIKRFERLGNNFLQVRLP